MYSDNEIAGDTTALPHRMTPPAEHPCTVAGFAGLLRTVADCPEHWLPLVGYDPTSRWYRRLRTGPGYELWLLSWLPGQGSGRHDHGDAHGVFTVLTGGLTEFTAGTREGRPLRPGPTRVFAPGYVHEMVNTSLEPAVSLHLYHPGLTTMPMHPAAAASPAARAEHPGLPARPSPSAAASPSNAVAPAPAVAATAVGGGPRTAGRAGRSC
ncbi:cysteine dioxygenase [Streptomyces sp. ventii]|uniref:Cysteine dioxygenase n=1 Tax=Streptomyces spiramenti TaxID=2720606 RepID=A0ABX1AUH7_9ACTN|nr:cysteine dioxygenase [Streptomyces spiramenti]